MNGRKEALAPHYQRREKDVPTQEELDRAAGEGMYAEKHLPPPIEKEPPRK
jgi:hypothetical protein